MATAVNAMAEMDGGFVLVREGKVVARVRLEVGGLMTARPVDVQCHCLTVGGATQNASRMIHVRQIGRVGTLCNTRTTTTATVLNNAAWRN